MEVLVVERNEDEYTKLIPNFKGAYIVYAECQNCKMPVQYPRDYPFNACPYCGKRVKYNDK